MGWPDDPLSRRHRDRAAARPAHRARALRGRAPDPLDSRACRWSLADERARDIDFVLVREQTEGLFASRGKGVVERRPRGVRHDAVSPARPDRARARVRLPPRRSAEGAPRQGASPASTRRTSSRSMAFFRKVFDEVREAPSRQSRPTTPTSTRWRSTWCRSPGRSTCWSPRTCSATSCPTSARASIGGMGMAPSADIGDEHALFQPATAPRPTSPARARPIPTGDVPLGRDDARLARRALAAIRALRRRGDSALERAVDEVSPRHDGHAARFGGQRRHARCDARRGLIEARVKRLRVAASARGYFSQFHLDGWRAHPAVQLVGWCDPTSRSRGVAFGGAASRSMRREMLDASQPDLVDIVTPPGPMLALVAAAAQRRLPAICQKPLAPTYAEAVRAGRGGRARRARPSSCTRTSASAVVSRGEAADRRGRARHAALGRLPPAPRRRPGTASPTSIASRTSRACRASRPRDRDPLDRHVPLPAGRGRGRVRALRRINPAIAGEDAGLHPVRVRGRRDRAVRRQPAQRPRRREPAPHDGRDAARRLGGRASPRRRGAAVVEAASASPRSSTATSADRRTRFRGGCCQALQAHVVEFLVQEHSLGEHRAGLPRQPARAGGGVPLACRRAERSSWSSPTGAAA